MHFQLLKPNRYNGSIVSSHSIFLSRLENGETVSKCVNNSVESESYNN